MNCSGRPVEDKLFFSKFSSTRVRSTGRFFTAFSTKMSLITISACFVVNFVFDSRNGRSTEVRKTISPILRERTHTGLLIFSIFLVVKYRVTSSRMMAINFILFPDIFRKMGATSSQSRSLSAIKGL